MNVKDILNEAVSMSKWEKIDSGVHTFKIEKVEYRLTDKSKREAIVYTGSILNSKGMEQVAKVIDIVDSEEGLKFGAARLMQFISHFGGNIEGHDTIESLVATANNYIGRTIKLEFVKKVVNGITIKEKVFLFNR